MWRENIKRNGLSVEVFSTPYLNKWLDCNTRGSLTNPHPEQSNKKADVGKSIEEGKVAYHVINYSGSNPGEDGTGELW